MKSHKLNIEERCAMARSNTTVYLMEKGSRAKAMPKLCKPSFVPSARWQSNYRMEKAVRLARCAMECNEMAHRAVYGMLKKLTANSGMSKDGKRPKTANNPNERLYAIRSELCKYDGLDGVHRYGEQGKEPVPYWARVDRQADGIAYHEAEARTHGEQASAYTQAMADAKRAGNMEQYEALRTLRNAERKAVTHHNAKAAELRKGMDALLHEPIGEGVELFNLVFSYYWERIAIDGLTWDSLCVGYAENGRKSVRSVTAWGYILVRREIRKNASARAEGANGHAYFSVEEYEQDGMESEYYRKIVRTPKYYDTTSVDAEETPVETMQSIAELVTALKLSEQQRRILHLRMQGKSINEIADILNVKRQSVQTQTKRIQKTAMEFFPADLIAKYIK